uniref:Uncharacterized protein n=1 Tax=Macaca fascicularis TaxID=9541 RepID=Q9BGR4_MACFA|nr:hypothetical protein [Macaca fascicularis]
MITWPIFSNQSRTEGFSDISYVPGLCRILDSMDFGSRLSLIIFSGVALSKLSSVSFCFSFLKKYIGLDDGFILCIAVTRDKQASWLQSAERCSLSLVESFPYSVPLLLQSVAVMLRE